MFRMLSLETARVVCESSVTSLLASVCLCARDCMHKYAVCRGPLNIWGSVCRAVAFYIIGARNHPQLPNECAHVLVCLKFFSSELPMRCAWFIDSACGSIGSASSNM